MRRVALFTALALALTVTACGGDSSSASPTATNRVELPRSYRFAPELITVPAGTTVTWTNSDKFTHTVRLLDDGNEVLKMSPGESVSFTFTEPGAHRYDCSLHPQNMRGSVAVTPSGP